MDSFDRTHPDAEVLRAYSLGELDDASAAAVARHLEQCPECERVVAAMAPDTFLNGLRRAQEEPEVSASNSETPTESQTDRGHSDVPSEPERDRIAATQVAAHAAAGDVPQSPAGQQPQPTLTDDATVDHATGRTAPEMSRSVPLSGPDSSTGDGLEPGTRVRYFGDYELLKVLGEGGMGIVYKARQLSLNRPVALKMIKATRFASAEDVRRFKNEAEAVARLDHPNIVPIFEVGQFEDQHYFSMKLISGESLDKRLKDYTTDFKGAAGLVATTARAILHAHQRGILHRDLKPANILLDSDGQPHVTDFGLAKRVEGDSELTRSGAILGTPAYMAPEQASGRRGSVTTSTDVYGLGAILYALLTGRAPFGEATVMDTLEQVRECPPVSPRKLNPRVPRDLEVICLKCLEKDPRRRYASADALAEELSRWLAGEPIAARPVGNTARLWMWCRRNRALAGAAGLVAASLMIVAVLSALYARQQAEAAAKISSLLTESKRRVAVLDFERGQAACEEGQIGLGLLWFVESLRAATDAGDPVSKNIALTNLSGWQRLHPRLMGVFDDSERVIRAVAVSHDGKRVLTTGNETARLWDAASGQVTLTLKGRTASVDDVAFSPDGKTIAGCPDANAQLWDATTGEPIGKAMEHEHGQVIAMAFSPNGKTIATGSRDKTARLWDAATGEPVGKAMEHQGVVDAVAISPDGKTIVTGSSDKTARLWDAATGQPIGKAMKHQNAVSAVAFSPDGKTIVTGSSDKTARLWDGATGQPIGKAMKHQNAVIAVAFSPNGTTILTGTMENSRASIPLDMDGNVDEGEPFGWDEEVVSVYRWDVASGVLLGKPFEHQRGVFAAFACAGKDIVITNTDGMARLWDASIGPQVGKPLEYDGWVSAVAFSPDGKTIVTGNRDSTARLWDAGTGCPIGRVMVHLREVTSVAFSPDGKSVLSVSGMALLWDAATGRPIGKPMEPEGGVDAAVFSPDCKAVLTAAVDTVRLWDAATGRPIGKPTKYQGELMAFSLDGKTIVTGCTDGRARLWDVATGRPIGRPMEHRYGVLAAAFSPDGKTIVTGSSDDTARLWDAASGQPIGKAMRHQGDATSVAFSPDGKTIVTGSGVHTARIWDAATGQPIGPVLPHSAKLLTAVRPSDVGSAYVEAPGIDTASRSEYVMSVAFSPDGKTVLTGTTHDTTARLWDTPAQLPDDPPRLAAWVQTLTGLELDEHGVAHMLDPVGWRKCRDLLHRLGGPPLADSDQLLHPIPFGTDPTARARASAERERWAELDATFDDLYGDGGRFPGVDAWMVRILAMSAAGARGGLRRVVSDLLERFRETSDPWTANKVAWYCVLAPDAVVEPEAPVRLAELAVKRLDDEEKQAALITLGAALYRAGRCEQAIRRLDEGAKARNGTEEPLSWPFLAMAHHRLGHRDEARRWLYRPRNAHWSADFNQSWNWNEQQIRLLRSEAEAVILYDPVFPADPFAH